MSKRGLGAPMQYDCEGALFHRFFLQSVIQLHSQVCIIKFQISAYCDCESAHFRWFLQCQPFQCTVRYAILKERYQLEYSETYLKPPSPAPAPDNLILVRLRGRTFSLVCEVSAIPMYSQVCNIKGQISARVLLYSSSSRTVLVRPIFDICDLW